MEPAFLIELVRQYSYLVIAPAALIFGPPISLVAGVLLRLEVIAIVPTVLALAIGELTADVLWYWLGRRYGDTFVRKFGRYVGVTTSSVAYAKELFAKHHDFIIFTSKITAGLGFTIPIFFTAGLSRVPFRRYMMLNIVGQFLWTSALLSIGYFLGHLYAQVGETFEKMAVFALVALIILSFVGFGRYLRNSTLSK